MHNIELPNATVWRTRLFFCAISIAASPLMANASRGMSSGALSTTDYPNSTPTAQYASYARGTESGVTGDAPAASSPSSGNAIVAGATSPTITGKPATSVIAGHTYTFRPTAKAGAGETLRFAIAHKPPWAIFSIATGELSGTPKTTQIGTYPDI